eukprot:5766072-Amphidinium_carterae.1
MLRVPNHPEPEGEPGTPPAKRSGKGTGGTPRGSRRPKSPPPPLRKMPPPAGDDGTPDQVPLPAGIQPIVPLTATAEM